MSSIQETTAELVGLLGIAGLIAIGAERLRVSSAVALVALGAVAAAVHPFRLPFAFGDTLLYVFLPPLIFEAAWNIDPASLRRVGLRIALLAVPGVVLVAALIGAGIAAAHQLPLAPAILLGAIVSATDPIAVIAIFRRLAVPLDLQSLVEGESIANDGVAIVLYGTALAYAAGTGVAPAGVEAAHAVVAIVGGVAIGAVLARIVAWIMGRTTTGPIEVTATVVLAFLAYFVAGSLSLSGVFATAAAGITLRHLQRLAPVSDNVGEVDSFWAAVAFIVNAFVFLVTGLTMQLGRMANEPVLVGVAIAVVLASRAVLAWLVIRQPAWRATVFLAGIRGGLSLALALALPPDLPYRAQIIDAVFAVVLFTLVVGGTTLEPLIARLGFQRGSGGPSLSS